MKFMRRGLAILLAVLLVIPGSPVSVERVLLTEAAEADTESEVESAELEKSSMANFEADGENGGKKEQGNTDNTVNTEGRHSSEMAEEPSTVEESKESSVMVNDDMDDRAPDAVEGDVEPGEDISVEDDAEDSDLGEIRPEAGLPGEEPVAAQILEEDLPVAYAANIIASGNDMNLTWTLDSDGLLTVSGTGDYSNFPSENSNLWGAYRDSITSAKVDVTGMTNANSLFLGCHNLISLDLSGFDTSNITSMSGMFVECSSLVNLDLSGFNTSNVTTMNGMFGECSSLTSLDLSSFNTSNVTDMDDMFYGCNSLTSLDLTSFNTGNLTTMHTMFMECSSLSSLDLSSFTTSNVTDMSGMFQDCNSLKNLDLSSFDTRNVTGMIGMFNNCSNLISLDLSNFDTGNVTNMTHMFARCEKISYIDLSSFDTSNVRSMRCMFQACRSLTSLDLSNFDTSNVTDMMGMFWSCQSLTSLDLSNFNTGNVTDMSFMFISDYRLTNLDISNFNTSKVTDMTEMFGLCSGLTSLELGSFDTSNVTKMEGMFAACDNLQNLNLSSFNTSKVTNMYEMFVYCGLDSLDLSGFDMGSVTNAEGMLRDCDKLITIQSPCNLPQPVALPATANKAWYLPDGTQITQLPQNLSESVLIERRDTEPPEPVDIWFRVTGATGHGQYTDLYIAENSDQNILDTFFDPLYENAYQTLFISDSSTDLANLAPTFESSADTEIHVLEQGQQISGQSTQDFSKGNVIYSAIQYTNADKTAFVRRDYTVAFAKKESGPRLFVNGPAERQIFLTDYFQNQHDILIANVGDGQLTGIHAELLDAVNIKLDDSRPVESALAAFDRIPGQGQEASDVMANLGKVRLVPDGEGEISGTLKITADGQEPVYIVLTGYSDNPRITTTTAELNMDDVIRVKYVPYSYTVETNNKYDWNRVTFSVEEGQLARGLQMYPATGEIYGVPLEAGEFNITVKATFSRPEFLPSYAQLTLIVKDNTDANVNVATDSNYDLIQRVQDIVLGTSDSGSQTMVSLGDYAEFKAVYLDGERLAEGTDYDSESGSTRITIRAQTLTGKGVGSHTLGIEFRTQDTNALRRAAQNYTVVQTGTGGSGNGGSHSGGAGSGADYNAVAEVSETVIYTVQPGDSLWRIAARFYGTGTLWRRIYEDNIIAIKNPNRIYAGQRLVIHLADSDRAGREAAAAGMGRRIYSVMLGDNLWTVAKKVYGNGMLWERIYRANRELILDARQIYAGQRIVIPAEE